MSEIKAGDLVVMCHTQNDLLCEHAMANIGNFFRVSAIEDAPHLTCPICYRQWTHVRVAYLEGKGRAGLRVSWLKKIDPPSEVEFTKTERELTV